MYWSSSKRSRRRIPVFEDSRLHLRMADCAKVDRVEPPQRADRVIGKGHPGFQVPLSPPIERGEGEGEGKCLRGLRENLDPFPDDFRACPVAGNDSDPAHGRFSYIPSSFRVASWSSRAICKGVPLTLS